MIEHLPISLWRLVPNVLFLGLAVPLYVRVIRGVVPADPAEGVRRESRRAEGPAAFRPWAALYLVITWVSTLLFRRAEEHSMRGIRRPV